MNWWRVGFAAARFTASWRTWRGPRWAVARQHRHLRSAWRRRTIRGKISAAVFFDFTPWALPFYSMNKSFASADSSEGWWARWVVVPFPNTFTGKENRGLDRELRTDAELSGVFGAGCRHATHTVRTRQAAGTAIGSGHQRKFIAASDAVRNFVDEDCELDHDASVRGAVLRGPAGQAGRAAPEPCGWGIPTGWASRRGAGARETQRWPDPGCWPEGEACVALEHFWRLSLPLPPRTQGREDETCHFCHT